MREYTDEKVSIGSLSIGWMMIGNGNRRERNVYFENKIDFFLFSSLVWFSFTLIKSISIHSYIYIDMDGCRMYI